MKLISFTLVMMFFTVYHLSGQTCCSGGSGSPIAGGTSQGVLDDRQVEISTSFQYINSHVFMTGDKRADNFLDRYNSKYQYTRLAYGMSKKLTLSLESGYFYHKTQVGLNKRDTISSSGIGDFIIFPRYNIYTHNTEKTRNEITLGVGLKMPIGKYIDSSIIYIDDEGIKYYAPKPAALVPTTGSNDFIFYGFAYRGYVESKFRIFSSMLYVRKGWNPLGQKYGDFASIGLFAGKTFFERLGITLELRGEYVAPMQYHKDIDMLAIYNLDVNSSGGKRAILAPQLSYMYKDLSVFAFTEIPLYQYINGTAIASQYQFTVGAAYRFYAYEQD